MCALPRIDDRMTLVNHLALVPTVPRNLYNTCAQMCFATCATHVPEHAPQRVQHVCTTVFTNCIACLHNCASQLVQHMCPTAPHNSYNTFAQLCFTSCMTHVPNCASQLVLHMCPIVLHNLYDTCAQLCSTSAVQHLCPLCFTLAQNGRCIVVVCASGPRGSPATVSKRNSPCLRGLISSRSVLTNLSTIACKDRGTSCSVHASLYIYTYTVYIFCVYILCMYMCVYIYLLLNHQPWKEARRERFSAILYFLCSAST